MVQYGSRSPLRGAYLKLKKIILDFLITPSRVVIFESFLTISTFYNQTPTPPSWAFSLILFWLTESGMPVVFTEVVSMWPRTIFAAGTAHSLPPELFRSWEMGSVAQSTPWLRSCSYWARRPDPATSTTLVLVKQRIQYKLAVMPWQPCQPTSMNWSRAVTECAHYDHCLCRYWLFRQWTLNLWNELSTLPLLQVGTRFQLLFLICHLFTFLSVDRKHFYSFAYIVSVASCRQRLWFIWTIWRYTNIVLLLGLQINRS